jgi:hypothetical protein
MRHEMKKQSQETKIFRMLQTGMVVTDATALKMAGTYRLSGRIYDLRKKGHNIVMDWKKTLDGDRYGSYRLVHKHGTGCKK